eukprot:COSAG04_NODE_504_length_13347_cov_231.910251_2_plen_171_part_00
MSDACRIGSGRSEWTEPSPPASPEPEPERESLLQAMKDSAAQADEAHAARAAEKQPQPSGGQERQDGQQADGQQADQAEDDGGQQAVGDREQDDDQHEDQGAGVPEGHENGAEPGAPVVTEEDDAAKHTLLDGRLALGRQQMDAMNAPLHAESSRRLSAQEQQEAAGAVE